MDEHASQGCYFVVLYYGKCTLGRAGGQEMLIQAVKQRIFHLPSRGDERAPKQRLPTCLGALGQPPMQLATKFPAPTPCRVDITHPKELHS